MLSSTISTRWLITGAVVVGDAATGRPVEMGKEHPKHAALAQLVTGGLDTAAMQFHPLGAVCAYHQRLASR